jgi:heptosyltransferase-2
MSSTVIIQTKQGIGDSIWHLPFIRAIAAYAGESVTVLALPSTHARELYQAEPAVAQTLYFENRGSELIRGVQLIRLIRMLRGLACRTVWILDRSARPALAAMLAGIPDRFGVGFGRQRWFITNAGIDQRFYHAMPIEWLKALMEAMQIPCPTTEPNLVLPSALVAEIGARFAALTRPWIAVGLGASHPDKDWPDAHWIEFLDGLRRRSGTIVLIGGQSQARRAASLIEQTTGAPAINACGLAIMESTALISHADIFIGPDSGPMNLAAAVGTHALGLFGATPVLGYSRFIHPILPDDGSTLASDGMRRISPGRVIAQLEQYLSRAIEEEPARSAGTDRQRA